MKLKRFIMPSILLFLGLYIVFSSLQTHWITTSTTIRGHRIGAICEDGWRSYSTGSGTCSSHGGVDYWLYAPSRTVTESDLSDINYFGVITGVSTISLSAYLTYKAFKNSSEN